MTAKEKNPIRILLADDELLLAQRMVDFLVAQGFVVKTAKNGGEVEKILKTWVPEIVIYDLMLQDMNALQFLKMARAQNLLTLGGLKVFVYSGQKDPGNVRECLRMGAVDYINKPVGHNELLGRILLHMRPKRELSEYQARTAADYGSAQYYLHLTDLTLREALKSAPVFESLHNLTGMVAHVFGAVRVSVVKCNNAKRSGAVIASNDRRSISAFPIDLAKYPEIIYVLQNDKMLALDNLANDPTMHFVTRQTKQINFNSMIVCPIRLANTVWGTLSIRMSDTKDKPLTEFELRYAQLISHVMGLVIVRDAALLLDINNAEPTSTDGTGDGSGRIPESA
jgi:DNA-binding response OmpR family regulator